MTSVQTSWPVGSLRGAKRLTAAAAGIGCLVLSGCFSGEYNARMKESISKLETAGGFSSVLYDAASPINDAAGSATGVTLRLPQSIGSSAKTLQSGAEGAQPPFVNLPGFSYAYQIDVGGQPAYAYFAAVAAGEKTADVLAQEVLAEISKTFSSSVWQNAQVNRPDGGTMAVRRMRVSGPQKFGASEVDGQFDLYLTSSASHHVLLGWRAPTVAGNSQNFFENAAAAIGTIQGGS